MSVMEGSLSKWTNVMKGWQYRWFVLDYNAGLLSYYTSKEKMMRGVRRGCVRLRAAVIGIDDEDDSTFTITVDHKTFHFQARDAEERERWVRALEDTISRHHRAGRGNLPTTVPGSIPTGSKPKDFEKRVTEADAYLQIMIDQVKKLEERISEIDDPETKQKVQGIHDQANAMLENIKHSIVLLQIAKNTVNPVNGVYQGPASVINTAQLPSASPTDGISGSSIMAGIEEGSECMERRLQLTGGPSMSLVVPDTSYSSSEEEDDFYDADDEPFSLSSVAGTPTIASRQNTTNTSAMTPSPGGTIEGDNEAMYSPSSSPQVISPPPSDNLPRKSDGTIDYDALYECESDSDIGSMETHGSVVTHLLSQVKIGMDLTKVVLPTFILERRSLLEMYADYFAHPDEFLKIADMPSPKDRMIQVVRWYLSSYHAGRKSAVAKKPYNPILGEVFRCHWNSLSSSGKSSAKTSSTDTTGCVTDGPIPWCSPNQLTFVAEQVSHHPPISAFYAEHVNKGISFDAWVWTKSKFLGLSIGVHNIGKGRVMLTDVNEEYVLTFPNGYGRSILTVPWIELGGPVSIECAATGYKAAIEFLTKPFYGGRKNKVTCEIFGPNEKRPIVTSAGEWNTKMDLKWADSGRSEILFDASNMKPHKKLVRPIESQANNESRKVWKDVTAGLKSEDIDGATKAKCRIEEAQREAVKLREANNASWETILFQRTGDDGWEYINPLKNRLQPSKSNQENIHSNNQETSHQQRSSKINIPTSDIAISPSKDSINLRRTSSTPVTYKENSLENN